MKAYCQLIYSKVFGSCNFPDRRICDMISIIYRALLVCDAYKFTFGRVERHLPYK